MVVGHVSRMVHLYLSNYFCNEADYRSPVNSMPIATTMASVNMRLKAGGIR